MDIEIINDPIVSEHKAKICPLSDLVNCRFFNATYMSKYAGQTMTIAKKIYDEVSQAFEYIMKNDGGVWTWTAEMIECFIN